LSHQHNVLSCKKSYLDYKQHIIIVIDLALLDVLSHIIRFAGFFAIYYNNSDTTSTFTCQLPGIPCLEVGRNCWQCMAKVWNKY